MYIYNTKRPPCQEPDMPKPRRSHRTPSKPTSSRQIAAALLEEASRSGEGLTISEHELAARFKISRPTANRILSELSIRGQAFRSRGRSTFIRPAAAAPAGVIHYVIPDANAYDYYAFPDYYRVNLRFLRGILAAASRLRCVLNLTLVRPEAHVADLEALLAVGGPTPVFLVTASYQYEAFLETCRQRNLPTVSYSGVRPASGHGVRVEAVEPYRSLLGWFFSQGAREAVFLERRHARQQDSWKRETFLEAAGRLAIPHRVIDLSDAEKAPEALEAAWGQRPFDALVCDTDSIALRAGRALREAGRRIPEEVRLLGCDHAPEAAAFSPRFPSLDFPFEEIGEALVAQARDLFRDPAQARLEAAFPARPVIF